MRTTVDLPDDLFRRVKARAALKGVSLKEFFADLIEKAMSEGFEEKGYGQKRPFPVAIPPAGRKIKSFTNAELDEIFLREEMEEWDR
jgi:hypothetical protein